MRYSWLSIDSWEGDFKDAVFVFCHLVGIAVPVVCNSLLLEARGQGIFWKSTEVSDQIGSHGVRCPFPVDNISVRSNIESIYLVTLQNISFAETPPYE